MTMDEALASALPEHREVIKQVIETLDALRHIDVSMIDHLRTMAELCRPLMPPDMQQSVDAMVIDLKLVRIFHDQAVKYDQSAKAVAAYDRVFGEEGKNG